MKKKKPFELMAKVARVVPHIRLEGIQMMRFSAAANLPKDKKPFTIHMQRQVKTKRDGKALAIRIDWRLNLLPEDVQPGNASQPGIFIESSHHLSYTLQNDAITADEIRAFAQVNAVMNAWPYWREFVQSTTSRLGLPPLTLPLITSSQLISDLEDNAPESAPSGE